VGAYAARPRRHQLCRLFGARPERLAGQHLGQPAGLRGLLPGQSASDAHIGDNIQALFGNDSSTKVMGLGDVYTFSYQNGNYVQDQPLGGQYTATGDVTGH
jgi:hypothetical protein